MDCGPPGSSVHGSLQARILEWVAIPFSRRSSQARDRNHLSCMSRRILYHWATGKWWKIQQWSIKVSFNCSGIFCPCTPWINVPFLLNTYVSIWPWLFSVSFPLITTCSPETHSHPSALSFISLKSFETYPRASLTAQLVKNLPAMQETLVWFLGWEDPLEKG